MRTIYLFVLKAAIALVPSVIVMVLLIREFPDMGVGRRVALPIAVSMNLLLIALGLFVSSRLSFRYSMLIWPFIIGVTLCVTVLMYPQDNRPSVAAELLDRLREHELYVCTRSDGT